MKDARREGGKREGWKEKVSGRGTGGGGEGAMKEWEQIELCLGKIVLKQHGGAGDQLGDVKVSM